MSPHRSSPATAQFPRTFPTLARALRTCGMSATAESAARPQARHRAVPGESCDLRAQQGCRPAGAIGAVSTTSALTGLQRRACAGPAAAADPQLCRTDQHDGAQPRSRARLTTSPNRPLSQCGQWCRPLGYLGTALCERATLLQCKL
jgi:hypothetical protein